LYSLGFSTRGTGKTGPDDALRRRRPVVAISLDGSHHALDLGAMIDTGPRETGAARFMPFERQE
jgi:hypothetical protein